MANNYFQFKQFTVQQEYCAMKVTTDACLFGAWVGNVVNGEWRVVSQKSERRILDIGTGTGLLALMLAQKELYTQIDAVEIDVEATKQATSNFNDSQWKDRLNIFNSDIISYEAVANYDFIVTNPPFFDNDLKSDSNKRNLAMHSEALSLEDLLTAVKRLLKEDGKFAILLPSHRSSYFEELSLATGFHLIEKVAVKQTPKHSSFRSMLLFGNKTVTVIEKEIIIKEGSTYTPEFATLLRGYYLHL